MTWHHKACSSATLKGYMPKRYLITMPTTTTACTCTALQVPANSDMSQLLQLHPHVPPWQAKRYILLPGMHMYSSSIAICLQLWPSF
jgi:hypothetical protein